MRAENDMKTDVCSLFLHTQRALKWEGGWWAPQQFTGHRTTGSFYGNNLSVCRDSWPFAQKAAEPPSRLYAAGSWELLRVSELGNNMMNDILVKE